MKRRVQGGTVMKSWISAGEFPPSHRLSGGMFSLKNLQRRGFGLAAAGIGALKSCTAAVTMEPHIQYIPISYMRRWLWLLHWLLRWLLLLLLSCHQAELLPLKKSPRIRWALCGAVEFTGVYSKYDPYKTSIFPCEPQCHFDLQSPDTRLQNVQFALR